MDDAERSRQGMSVRRELRNGLSPEQIREVLLQVAVDAGVPAGNRAFAVAQRALREQDALPEQGADTEGDAPDPA